MAGNYQLEGSYQPWLWDKLGEKCVGNLKKHGFDAHLVSSGNEARDLILAWRRIMRLSVLRGRIRREGSVSLKNSKNEEKRFMITGKRA